MNLTTAFGAELARPDRQPREGIKNPLGRVGKTGMGNVVLDIRLAQTVTAADKTDHNTRRKRQDTPAAEGIAQNLANQRQPPCRIVQRYVLVEPPREPGDIMISQVFADPWQRHPWGNAQPGQPFSLANARQLQQLR